MEAEQPSVPELSIVSQITTLRQKQESLFAAARERRADILAELAGLCVLLGALTRDEVPDGVLKRRRAKKGAKKAAAPRKAKGGETPLP